ncbi:DUF1275 family protein, partial [Streptosporangium algeriense]
LARWMPDARREFTVLTAVHALLVAAALVVVLPAGHRTTGVQATLIALLGYGMGLQNAAARRLAVPDLVTITVLTSTLTRLAADPPERAGLRRSVSITALFTGALTGAILFLNLGAVPVLAVAATLLTAVTLASRSRRG